MPRTGSTHDEAMWLTGVGGCFEKQESRRLDSKNVSASVAFQGLVVGRADSACVASGFPSGSQIRSRNRQSTAHRSVCSF